jgi:hypothetical protein
MQEVTIAYRVAFETQNLELTLIQAAMPNSPSGKTTN